MKEVEREMLMRLKEKGIPLDELKGKTVGEVKEMTRQYKAQLNKLED